MSRLVSMFMLWLLLLLAAAPASAVMDVQPRNCTWELPASSYDLAGRAVRLLQPNGNLCWNVHDELGRLKSRALYVDAGAAVEVTRLEWYHDALGNVVSHDEQWPVSSHRPQGWRRTNMSYDDANRLTEEVVSESAGELTRTTYGYDDASNRASKAVQGGEQPGFWSYHYNESNQLRTWEKRLVEEGPVQKNGVLHYDSNGNRTSQGIQDAVGGVQLTSYAWDAQDRLKQVTMPDGVVHGYRYDHRTRRIGITKTGGGQAEQGTTVVFSGGLSLAEWEVASASLPTQIASPGVPTVEYSRGPDMGGGVGGLLYSRRGTTLKYNLSNGRGDIVAQSDAAGALTWTASYEAYGKRTKETGENADKQRANTKDEDPTGLLNEGFRYRDLETGVWLSRDPAGFVDGPNLYAYVQQNPWSKFDAEGMFWSAIVTAGFAAYDTYQYATGQISGAEYSKAMALNGAALLADVSTGGMGGGLALRALNAGVKVAKAVDKANNIVETAQAAVETTENIVSAVQEGDGRGVMRAAGAGILGAITDKSMGKKGRGADAPKQRAEGSYGELRKAGDKDAHHIIQHAAMEDIPGYNRDAAPAVQLDGPSTLEGSEHKAATDSQKRSGGGTYGAERKIGYRALREAGIDKTAARGHIERADKYFESIGVDKSTPTRTVGNRRRR